MTVSTVEVRGVREVIEMLGALPGEVKKAARTSLNRQATATRKTQLVEPMMAATGIKRATLNARLPISKAGSNDLKARIRASSGGIPVPDYRYTSQPTGKGRTRHRILVGWPVGGQKVAAGFINPLGQYRAPLTTRRKGLALAIALAPSAAALRKAVYDSPEEQETANQLGKKFNDFLADIVQRRPVPNE